MKTMKPLVVWLIGIACCLPEARTVEPLDKGWSSVAVLSNEVISVRLLFKRSASIADTNWLALELENHTPQTLNLSQIWVDVSGTRKDLRTGEALSSGSLTGGAFRSIRTLPPGIHRIYGDALESASGNLGMPTTNGLRFEAQVNVSVRLDLFKGPRFEAPRNKAVFEFEWRYPSAAEFAEMSRELKRLVAAHPDLEKNSSRIYHLLGVSPVWNGLTLDDYLPALKASRGMRVRSELAAKFSAKYSNAPPVLAYYREAIQSAPNEFQPEDEILWDRVDPKVWGELFLEPLVQRCEQGKWEWAFSALRYRTGWKNRPAYVARISAALLKHHPILLRAVRQIPENELEPWARAVREAGAVGDLALVELLKPALEDRRQAPINLGAGGVNEGRVCDRALFAILNILDGDSFAAFKKAGVTDWNEKAFDRMIGVVKERLKTLQPPPTK